MATVPTTANDLSSASSGSASTLAPAKIVNTTTGDIIVALAAFRNANGTLTADAGWIFAGAGDPNESSGVWYKPIRDASLEPATYNFGVTGVGSSRCGVNMFRITGADTGSALLCGKFANTGTTSVIAPSIDLPLATLVFAFAVANTTGATSSTFTAPAGFTAIQQVSYNNGASASENFVSFQAFSSPGATGTQTTTIASPAASSAASWLVQLLVPSSNYPEVNAPPPFGQTPSIFWVPPAIISSSITNAIDADASIVANDAVVTASTVSDFSNPSIASNDPVISAAAKPAEAALSVAAQDASISVSGSVIPGTANDISLASSVNASTLAPVRPPNTTNGDYLIAQVMYRNAGGTLSADPGWVFGGPADTNETAGFYYKYINDVTQETASYNFNCAGVGSSRCGVQIFRVTGQPIGTAFYAGPISAYNGTGTLTFPAVNTPTTNTIVIALGQATTSTSTPAGFQVPGGYSLISSQSFLNSGGTATSEQWAAYQVYPSAGSTGTVPVTLSPAAANSSGWLVQVVAPVGNSPLFTPPAPFKSPAPVLNMPFQLRGEVQIAVQGGVADVAPATFAGQDVSEIVGPTPAEAAPTFAAQNATISTSNFQEQNYAGPQFAPMFFSPSDAATQLHGDTSILTGNSSAAGNAFSTFAANGPGGSATTNSDLPTPSFAAQDVGGATRTPAGIATPVIGVNTPTPSVKANAGLAAFTGTAFNALPIHGSDVVVFPECASWGPTALDADAGFSLPPISTLHSIGHKFHPVGPLNVVNYALNPSMEIPSNIAPLTFRENVVTNPSFENDLSAWIPINGTFAQDTSTYAPDGGTTSAKFTNIVTGLSFLGAAYTAVPGDTWTLSAFVNPTTSANWHLQINYFNGSSVVISSFTSPLATIANQWQKLSITGLAPAGTATIGIYLTQGGIGLNGDICYLDNVLLEKAAQDNGYFDGSINSYSRINLCSNPKFSTGTSGWVAAATNGVPSLDQDFAHHVYGKNSMKITWQNLANNPSVNFPFPTIPGKTYTLSAFVFIPEGNPNVTLSASGVLGSTPSSNLRSDWQRPSYTFTATGTTHNLVITGSTTAGVCYVNGVLIEATASLGDFFDGATASINGTRHWWMNTADGSLSYESTPNLVPNWEGTPHSSKSQLSALRVATWTSTNADFVQDSSATFHSSFSGKLIPNSLSLMPSVSPQPFKVIDSTDYIASFFMYIPQALTSTGITMQYDAYDSNGVFISTTLIPITTSNAATPGFVRFSPTFTTPVNTASVTIKIRPSSQPSSLNDVFYIDAFMFEQASIVNPFYVDGDTAGYCWDRLRLNLVTNPSFEAQIVDWDSLNCSLARETDQSYVGSASLGITALTTGDTEASWHGGSPLQTIPVVPGDVLSASFALRAKTSARSVRIYLRWFDSAGSQISQDHYETTDSNTQWTSLILTATAPATATYATVAAYIFSPTAGETHYLDGVLVEKSPFPGAYFDGPYDIARGIARTLQTAVPNSMWAFQTHPLAGGMGAIAYINTPSHVPVID